MSLQLGGFAMLIAVFGGVALGSLAALRQNKPADYGTMAVAMTGISVPNFVLAPLLVARIAPGIVQAGRTATGEKRRGAGGDQEDSGCLHVIPSMRRQGPA